VRAVPVGAGPGRARCVALVPPGVLVGVGNGSARPVLSPVGAELALLLALARDLLCGFAPHVLLEPPLGRAGAGEGSLLGPQLLPHLPELRFYARPVEIAAQRRVRNPITVGSSRSGSPASRRRSSSASGASLRRRRRRFTARILALRLTHH